MGSQIHIIHASTVFQVFSPHFVCLCVKHSISSSMYPHKVWLHNKSTLLNMTRPCHRSAMEENPETIRCSPYIYLEYGDDGELPPGIEFEQEVQVCIHTTISARFLLFFPLV
jgi:hypothetical protein